MKLTWIASFMCAGCVCASAETTPATTDTTATPRFIQDQFAIGFWVDPPMDDKADARYKEIADAYFTMVIGGFGANQKDPVIHQLELCEKYGLKAVVMCRDLPPSELPESPACWGYGLRDEPNASEFPTLADQVAALRVHRPGRLAYINLFPGTVDPQKVYGTTSYEEYVDRFIKEVKPDVLSMDHYPLFKPDHDTRDLYVKDLDVMRRYSQNAGIPFWNFFNIMPYGPHTDPTEGQLRWQVFTSIAYGAKGLMYFCYYTPLSHEFPKGGAIIGRDDLKTRHWYQARRLNEQLKNLGPVLMRLTSTGVYRIGPDDDPAKVLEGTPIKTIKKADVDPPFDYLIGVFTHEDGRRAVMLNNYRFAYTAWPTVEFDTPTDSIVEIDKWSGKEIPLRDDSPDMDGLQLSLDDGEGRLFLLPEN